MACGLIGVGGRLAIGAQLANPSRRSLWNVAGGQLARLWVENPFGRWVPVVHGIARGFTF